MSKEHFDKQIRDALRLEPAAGQIARLEEFWNSESRRERQKRMVRRGLALAASLLISASIVGWFARQRFDGVELVDAPNPQEEVVPKPIEPVPDSPMLVDSKPSSPSIGREPTALEKFAFYSQSQRHRNMANENLVAVVDDMVEQVSSGQTDPHRAVEDAGIAVTGIERELLRRLARAKNEHKPTLLQLLAVSGSQKSMPALLRLSRRGEFREETLATIEQIFGTAGLADVVRQSNDPRVRIDLMQRMLASDLLVAAENYLSLVQNPTLRGEALSAADRAKEFPTEMMFALLQSDDERIRLSAALVLGHMNGPEITRQLVALVTEEQPAPTEAWMALLSCRGEVAEEFLSYATRNPQLLGHVNQARTQWVRMNL